MILWILTLSSLAPIALGFTTSNEDIVVTRNVYVDFVTQELNPESLVGNPNRGQYGPRHSLPALAVYALTGDKKYGEAIKSSLRFYDQWLQEEIKTQGAHFSWEGPYLCGFHIQELRKGGLVTEGDEKWIREMFIRLADNLSAWKPGDGLWRGSQHRSQGQAIARGLAAMWYPDCPKSQDWNEYFKVVWNDWWQYKDVGINDTGYFFGSFIRILCAAELMGKEEVFTDPDVQKFIWDRIIHEVTPAGAVTPYGAHGGWNSEVGSRILALELAAKHTNDGRYRWVAQRLMNYLMKNGRKLHNQHHIHATNIEMIALASVLCDDSIQPIEPDSSSKVLYRKEVLRLTNEQVEQKYPGYGGLDCNMDMSQKIMPHKVIMRGGWNPDDLYMMIEAFPRHDPLNPTAILGLMSNRSAMTMMESEKFISRENAVRIEDLSGNANYLGKDNYQGNKQLPIGYDGMEVSVKEFSDHKLASHVILNVTNYMGYKAEHEREVLFIKNRFVFVRDKTTFDDSFKCRIGPVWNSQYANYDTNWVNTYLNTFYFQGTEIYDNPRYDLLVYHSPKSDRKLVVEQRSELENARLSTQYLWEGNVTPGFSIEFNHILVPHDPRQPANELASAIKFIKDDSNLVILKVHNEWVVINPNGEEYLLPNDLPNKITTDAKVLYIAVKDGKTNDILALGAKFFRMDDNDIFKSKERKDFEQIK
ncbi:TPA: hypothetical protein ENX78_07025 [Candidatus Poribacteria bacterium]|nr:hypothetical protein [Candidatus Poribacteria bacterium]